VIMECLKTHTVAHLRECSRCGQQLPITHFQAQPYRNGQRRRQCRVCRQVTVEAWRLRHKEYDNEHKREYRLKRITANPVLEMLKGAQSRAKKQGIPFDLTLSDLVVPVACPVLGIVLSKRHGKGSCPASPSLDRVIPDHGYVRGNVHIISMRANRLKSNATIDDLEAVLAYMKRVTSSPSRPAPLPP
jgi:hypothetical protein